MRTSKIRFLYMVIVGISVSLLLDLLKVSNKHEHGRILGFAISVAITIFIWEGNLIIDRVLNRHFPWEKNPIKRILVHLPLAVVFSAIGIYLSMQAFNTFVCPLPAEIVDEFMLNATILGVLISIIILSTQIGAQFFVNWKTSLLEVEKYKTESLQAQLQNLKDQINPHFLFNNMSVLSSLVYKDQDKAVDFINQMSKVYRYLLDNRSTELVTLSDELTFIRSYTYLLKIRFDTNIIFNFDLEADKLHQMIPTLALQILIENAIKHNEVSSEQPLTISATLQDDMLVVKNNLQLRTNKEESCKTGLQNIKDRYRYFTEHQVEVIQNNTSFIVKLPLLKAK
jgi:two-component system, LytTR family, sensor kinase